MSKSIKVEVTLALKVPMLPNFMRTEQGDTAIPIEDIGEDTLRAMGQAWTDALVEHARNRAKEVLSTDEASQ